MGGYVPSFDVVLTSLSTATNMVKGFVALKQEGERQQLVIDLQNKILDAQQAAMDALREETEHAQYVQALEARVKELEDQQARVAGMRRKDGMSFLPDDGDPCCTRCAEVELKVVHLLKTPRLERARRTSTGQRPSGR